MRTRFPPSPTGLLHVGGLRTALFNYLLAKQSNDAFILRVEDTDQERSVDGAMEDILQTLERTHISPDEGVVLQNGKIAQVGNKGPYIQSERLDIYRKHAMQLIEAGHAYYAFDTPEEIERMREEEQKAGNPSPKYDIGRRMRMKNALTLSADEVQTKLDASEPYVIRLKIPENTVIKGEDAIRGKVEFQSHTVDDAVLLKADGFPTYHLANVVDDHLMAIDLVLRGEEWLPSLPKHLLLYDAFGWERPQFAHVPLLLNKTGGKLSKRQGDVGASEFLNKGYLPEALINFLALLGWNPGGTEEIFSLDDLVQNFTLERVQKGGAVFDEEKLDWLQGQWMRRFSADEFATRIKPLVAEKYPTANDDENFESKATLIQERITFFHEAPEMLSYYYSEPVLDMEIVANKKQKVTEEMVPHILSLLIEYFEDLDDEFDWNPENLKDDLFQIAKDHDLKNGQLLWPLRAILTGLPYSPGAFEVAAALGKEKTLKRLKAAQSHQ